MKFIKTSIPLCYVIFTLTLESGSGSGSGASENCSPSSSGSVRGLPGAWGEFGGVGSEVV